MQPITLRKDLKAAFSEAEASVVRERILNGQTPGWPTPAEIRPLVRMISLRAAHAPVYSTAAEPSLTPGHARTLGEAQKSTRLPRSIPNATDIQLPGLAPVKSNPRDNHPESARRPSETRSRTGHPERRRRSLHLPWSLKCWPPTVHPRWSLRLDTGR